MSFWSQFSHLFAFKSLIVTSVILFLYAFLFASTIVNHEDPPPIEPSEAPGLDLDAAWRDLQVITARPHPYNSHYNDVVREYVLSRLKSIVQKGNNTSLVDDLQSNGTYTVFGDQAVYFEGNNILVSVNGTHPESPAVLFSAHYDSVSTGLGATDDGMGVVTLIQLVEYFSHNRPDRTVIFNINNGEEDYLNGAVVFLVHPWSTLPKTFLNLEGAGSGGRPLLFRSSNAQVTRAFQSVVHPEGNVLSSDGFKRGLIRSGTDYSVYETAGMSGLDLAFYRKRSRYHTKYDSVADLGSKGPLWAMMESSLHAGLGLIQQQPDSKSTKGVVYFDILGEALAVFDLNTFFIWNVILLVLGPILVTGLAVFAWRKQKLYFTSRGWTRFVFAFVFGVSASWILTGLYIRQNPFIVYSAPYSVFVSSIAVIYTVTFIFLRIADDVEPVALQRTIILLQLYVVFWILLILDTVLVRQYEIGGFYFLTFFAGGSLLAVLTAFAEVLLLPAKSALVGQYTETNDPNVETRLEADREPYGSTSNVNGDNQVRSSVDDPVHHFVEEDHDDATEETPLIRVRRKIISLKSERTEEKQIDGMWLAQLLLLLPFPVLLVIQVALMMLTALSQTLADGSSAALVYYFVLACSVFIVLPIVPFIHKIHWSVGLTLAIIFFSTAIYNTSSFPFSSSDPLKISFQQQIDLDSGFNTVTLIGVSPYLSSSIVPAIPSSYGQTVHCDTVNKTGTSGLQSCTWIGIPPRVVPDLPGDYEKWLDSNVTRLSDNSATISVAGVNTRNIRIYFDEAIVSVHVADSSNTLSQKFPIPEKGVKEIRLWSRTWDKRFELNVTWAQPKDVYSGTIGVEWADASAERVPAYEEFLTFLPKWSSGTKITDGLVEGKKLFKV